MCTPMCGMYQGASATAGQVDHVPMPHRSENDPFSRRATFRGSTALPRKAAYWAKESIASL